jgi:hypothetical protein
MPTSDEILAETAIRAFEEEANGNRREALECIHALFHMDMPAHDSSALEVAATLWIFHVGNAIGVYEHIGMCGNQHAIELAFFRADTKERETPEDRNILWAGQLASAQFANDPEMFIALWNAAVKIDGSDEKYGESRFIARIYTLLTCLVNTYKGGRAIQRKYSHG